MIIGRVEIGVLIEDRNGKLKAVLDPRKKFNELIYLRSNFLVVGMLVLLGFLDVFR